MVPPAATDNLKKIIEIKVAKWYYKKRKSTHSKVDAYRLRFFRLSKRAASPVVRRERHFYFR